MGDYLLTLRIRLTAPDDVAARVEAQVKSELIGEALGDQTLEVKLQQLDRGAAPRSIKIR